MKARPANFAIVVATWKAPMFLMPPRLTHAGIQRPASTSRIDQSLVSPVLMNTSTYSTQPTAIAALPAQAVIQYDQAFANPSLFPNATRA